MMISEKHTSENFLTIADETRQYFCSLCTDLCV